MFSKTNSKPTPAAKPASAPVPPLETPAAARKPVASGKASAIGSGIIIEGNVIGTGDLVLDGTVRGDVKVGHLVVGESGNIEGRVDAESVDVRGRIVGTIQGRQIRLQATAYVEGDITHDQLAIETGAFFQGRCVMATRPDAAAPSVATIAEPAPSVSPAAPSPNLSSYDMSALGDLR